MEIRCKNCGSVRFSERDGVWTCKYCGSTMVTKDGQARSHKQEVASATPRSDVEVVTQATVAGEPSKVSKPLSVFFGVLAAVLITSLVIVGFLVASEFGKDASSNYTYSEESSITDEWWNDRVAEHEKWREEQTSEYESILNDRNTSTISQTDSNQINSIISNYIATSTPLTLNSQLSVVEQNMAGNNSFKCFTCNVHNNKNVDLRNVEFTLYYNGDIGGIGSTTVQTIPANSNSSVMMLVRSSYSVDRVKLSYKYEGETYYLISEWQYIR